MNFKNTIKTAFRALKVNKSRSGLTILGIVIGVAAIIIVMSLGKGAQDLILNEISSLGAETAVVQPGGDDFTSALITKTITLDDFEALKDTSRVPNLVDAMPVVVVSETISRRSETFRPVIIGGVARFFTETFDIHPEEGDIFGETDIGARRRVAVIGSEVKEKLFGNENALGETVRINNERFRVIGVFGQIGQKAFFNIDDLVLVPYTAATTYLTGDNLLTEIILRADSPDNIDKFVYDITATMRESHNISSGQEDDFVVRTQQALVDQISIVVNILTAFLSSVVAISLIVGGIGIMNIMLVSVTERTKEIGLRKALGATKGDILKQFLYEAVMLTGIGGIIGIVMGALVSFGVSLILAQTVASSWSFSFPISAAVIGIVVSGGIGLIFGIYPANQAAKKSPIEALRYE